MFFRTTYPVTCHTNNVGEGSTFVAIQGFSQDGTHFVSEAIKRGARTIVLSNHASDHIDQSLYPQVRFLFVEDTRKTLAKLSSDALGNPASKLKLIGITGTAGKTSTVFLIEHMLRCAGKKTAMLGSIKNKILQTEVSSCLTTPESDYLYMFFHECVARGVEYVVMEVSSHAIALQRTYGLEFDCVGFTNLSSEHMDFHQTMDDYFATKCRLFSQVKKNGGIVINSVDAWGKKALQDLSKQKRDACAVTCDVLLSDESGIRVRLHDSSEPIFASSMLGAFNGQNTAMAYRIVTQFGIGEAVIRNSLSSFPGVPGRMQTHRLKNGALAVVDFAHKSGSFEAVLHTLRDMTTHLIVLFGCGGDRDQTKRPVMGKLAGLYGDEIIVTDDNPRFEDSEEIIRQICFGIDVSKHSVTHCIPDRGEAIKRAVALSKSGSIIAILGKGDENYYLCKGKKYYFNDGEHVRKL